MAKKSSSKGSSGKAPKAMSADEHRKMAQTLNAKARIHSAKADLADAMNPSKKKSNMPGCY
jgi:hypothetical protein